jgi:hypothetical protein
VIIKGAVSHPDAGRYALGLRVPALTPSATSVWVGEWEEPRALGSKFIVVDVDDGDGFVRKEALVSFVEHTGGIIAEYGLRLNTKVTHHGVAVPSAHHPYVA